MTDSNNDLDTQSGDFEDAFEVQDGDDPGDFIPAEAPGAPDDFLSGPPPDVATDLDPPSDDDPLDEIEMELGAELEQIVKPKEEFKIGGDDEYDSIESEAVPAAAPKRSAEEEEARQRARARAERNRLRRLAEREEAASQEEEEEEPAPRQRRRAPPPPEVEEQRRRAEVQRKARQKEIAMNRRIVTGSFDDEDEAPQREYRRDGEWDANYRRRKPRSTAMIVGMTLLGIVLVAALIAGVVFGYLWISANNDNEPIETAEPLNQRSPRSAPSFDDEDDYRPQSPSQLEDEMISKSELLRASGSVLRAIMNRLDTIRTELDRIDESRRRIDDAFMDIEDFMTEIQNQRVRRDRDDRRRSGRENRKSKKRRKRNN